MPVLEDIHSSEVSRPIAAMSSLVTTCFGTADPEPTTRAFSIDLPGFGASGAFAVSSAATPCFMIRKSGANTHTRNSIKSQLVEARGSNSKIVSTTTA